jgi:AcrR family transcriptional regulator
MPQKSELLPGLAAAFAELGYRRATTAALAQRCQVQETTLYRIWTDKKAMFVDTIDYVGENSLRIYKEILRGAHDSSSPAKTILDYESKHIGEFRKYRIVFSALPEANDPDVRHALQRVYHRVHAFIVQVVSRNAPSSDVDAATVSWGIIGLGTIMTILDELCMMNREEIEEVFKLVGSLLIRNGDSSH